MKRKNFITTALLSLPAWSFANLFSSKAKDANPSSTAKKGFVVRADESRYDGITIKPNGPFLRCNISTVDTGGQLFIQTSTPKVFEQAGGPPPHVHAFEDEIIYIVSGQFVVHIDGEDFKVNAGDSAFIPRGTVHTVTNPVANNKGTLVTIFQPAPKKVEDFFHYISDHGAIPPDNAPDGW